MIAKLFFPVSHSLSASRASILCHLIGMHFNFYASLALVLLAGGCSSSKSLDEGSDEANADEATYPAAAPNEPSRARRTAEPSPVTEPSKLEQAQAALAAGEPQAAA